MTEIIFSFHLFTSDVAVTAGEGESTYLRQSGSAADTALPIDGTVDCGSTRRVVIPGLVVV